MNEVKTAPAAPGWRGENASLAQEERKAAYQPLRPVRAE
jgi:hypothetical protein